MRPAAWLLWSALALAPLPAAELAITACDGVARAGLPLRFRIERSTADDDGRGPWTLQVSLEQDGRRLDGIDLPIVRLAQVRTGITATLRPDAATGEAPLRLHAVLTSAARDLVEQAEHPVPTPASLAQAARVAAAQATAGNAAPLPRLWAEQAAETALLPPSAGTCERLALLTRRLADWSGSRRAPPAVDGVHELACADAVDGSVQPCRLHLPIAEALAITVVLAEPAGRVIKADWPHWPASWLAAARDAGVAVVEVYPAGDRTWTGVGPRRAQLALATVRAAWPALAATPAVLIGQGTGACGVLALAEQDPLAWRAVALVAPRWFPAEAGDDAIDRWLDLHRPGRRPGNCTGLPLFCAGPLPPVFAAWHTAFERAGGQLTRNLPTPDDRGFWRVLAAAAGRPAVTPAAWTILAPGRYGDRTVTALATWGVAEILRAGDAPRPAPRAAKRLDRACGPLAAVTAAPFVVVVGTGEHAAARAGNRRLADRFIADWRAHAHGDPPQVRDVDFRAADWPRHHLVLVGNPRSNRVCADLVDDARLPVRWDGRSLRCDGITLLRAAQPPFAMCRPHPDADGRLLAIIDGDPAWRADGMPLADLPDLVLGPVERPLVRRLFDNGWR